ncbi:hypothetical protein [Litchfieldella rifensis]|uniref:RiboL-PSP-HEPN domain-containing protein n=1 Tax=Litchfieldella rifensis TaxID=762643 RepID=A0ABV7LIA7_9GAMM
MDEATRIHDYLPTSYADKSEEAYIRFLWDAFETNYNAEKYEFANLAFHLLYMSYVCFSVWQIRAARRADFDNAMVGFQREVENKLATAETPFKFFENLKESAIFRFIKLVGCSNEQVGEFSKFVKQRNRIAHPSGNVFFNSKENIDEQIEKVMTEIDNIQRHMTPVLHDCLQTFLLENADAEVWEYSLPEDQIDAALIHPYYFSHKDIDACLDFDISALDKHADAGPIRELFDIFKVGYPPDR